jgi:hypothetical protein
MKTRRMAALLSISLLVSACATTTTRSHPTLEEQLNHINSVVNERLTDQEEIIRTELIEVAKVELVNHGYEIVEFDFDSAMKNDEEFAYIVTQIREGFDKAKEDLQLGKQISEEQARKLKISLGEAANIVAAVTGADAILLMRYAGFDKSDGYVAKDVGTTLLVGILTMGQVLMTSPMSGAVTEVALIDGITGDLLWADIGGGHLGAGVAARAMSTLPQDVDPDLVEAQHGPKENVISAEKSGG